MLYDLFINILILISSVFIGASIFKEYTITRNSSLKIRLLIGFMCAFMALLLMSYSIQIDDTNTLVDLRHMALMIAFYLGGILSFVVAAFFTIIYRLFLNGYNHSSLFAILNIILYLVVYVVIDKTVKKSLCQYIWFSVSSLIIIVTTLLVLLHDVVDVLPIILNFLLVALIAHIILYYLMTYVNNANIYYRKYKHEAKLDFLTGLYNLREFQAIFNQKIKKLTKLAVFMIDIDHFKDVNDTYGHDSGDKVLIQLTEVMKQYIRETGIPARVGGEEFCVLLSNTDLTESLTIAESIRKAVEAKDFIINQGQIISITVSIGVAVYPDTEPNTKNLLIHADEELYRAKTSGRNRVCY